jgi:hypothetical protein
VGAKGHHVNDDALVFVKRSIEKRESNQEKIDREQKKSRIETISQTKV